MCSRIEHRRWLPRYERWKKIAAEMGLEESTNFSIVEGKYRNHHVEIDEIDIADHIGGGDDDTPELKTRYIVELENNKPVLMYLKKHFSLPIRNQKLSKDYVHDIKIDEGDFDGEFVIKGNSESDIREILDPSIRSKIMNTRNSLYEIYIGYRKNYRPDAEIESQNIRYVDSRSLYETKGNAERFQLIIDTLIDIVEKIEALNHPSEDNISHS